MKISRKPITTEAVTGIRSAELRDIPDESDNSTISMMCELTDDRAVMQSETGYAPIAALLIRGEGDCIRFARGGTFDEGQEEDCDEISVIFTLRELQHFREFVNEACAIVASMKAMPVGSPTPVGSSTSE